MSSLLKILIGILLVLFVAYVGISIYIATQLTKPVPSPITEDPKIVSENFQDVSFTTSDGFRLKGWLFKNPESDKLIIFVSGTNQNRTGEYYGTIQIAKEAFDRGYSVLLFDRRTTGESDGDRITFGIPERLDIVSAVEFSTEKGYDRKNIGIIANSLGAISTLMGISELNDVGAIVLDSPASRVQPIVENILQKEKHLPAFLNPGVFLAANLLYAIDLSKVEPIMEVQKVSNRIFLYLHGDKDSVIPKSNSEELLSKSNPESKLVVFEGAAHVKTYRTNPELYRTEVFNFLNSQLNK